MSADHRRVDHAAEGQGTQARRDLTGAHLDTNTAGEATDVIDTAAEDTRVLDDRAAMKAAAAAFTRQRKAPDEKRVTQAMVEGALDIQVVPTVRTREAWLLAAAEEMRPWFAAHEATYEARVSIGWPAGRSAKANTIGQCFKESLVADGVPAVFISPVLTEPVEILSTLAHELVHAALPVLPAPHRGAFVKLAKGIGLVAPWTATTAGDELRPRLEAMAAQLGPFGHAAVSKGIGGRKVQTTRMLKVECPQCECMVRMTRKWLDEVGAPTCACGSPMAEATT